VSPFSTATPLLAYQSQSPQDKSVQGKGNCAGHPICATKPRHIAATLYLREKPGDFETVRRLLKHRTLQTTMDFYADLSNKWAHEQYDKVVLSKWRGPDV